jgi:putative flippase GtrA
MIRFAFVGLSGVFVNLAIYFLCYEYVFETQEPALRRNFAVIGGIFVSIFTNFVLNDRWTWGDRLKGHWTKWFQRLLKYYIAAGAGALAQLGVFNAGVALIGEGYHLLANLGGIGIATVVNYVLLHLWSFRDSESKEETKA